MNGKELIQAMHSGKRVYGTCIVSPSPKFIGYMGGIGLDFVFIDTEHIPIDIHNLSWMCHAYNGIGLAPIVRIPEPDPYQASRVIDAGARGIIAPYVESVEEVVQMRGAVKMKPLKGKRMQGILKGEIEPTKVLDDYIKKYNENNALIVNIESVPAMEALDDILDVPELDAVLIGPHDLTVSLDIPQQYDHPLFDEAVRTIVSKARAKNVGAAIHFWPSVDLEIAWAKEVGLNVIIHHSDVSFLKESILRDVGKLRKALGDEIIGEVSEEAI